MRSGLGAHNIHDTQKRNETPRTARSRFIEVSPLIEPGINHEHYGLWVGPGPGEDGGMLVDMRLHFNEIIDKQKDGAY